MLICLSFRKDTEDHVKHTAGVLNGKWTLTIPENNPDIEAYIDAELHERLESSKLCIGNPAIILSIQHALVTGAQGMFLWATLLLDCICMEQTDEAILQALESLPQSLSETFTRVLQQAGASNLRHRHRIVQIVMAARRPLSVEELGEALSVIPGDTTWEPAQQINNIYAALASCKCLIIIDEEEQTVRFAHHSVKQFFIAQGDEPGNTNPINPDEANKEMGRIILTYLNYGIFDRQVSRTVFPTIPADAPARIVNTIFGGSANTKRIALELLKTRKNRKCDIGQTLAEMAMAQRISPVQSHPFVIYAKEYYMYHILGVWDCDKRMERRWQCILDNESLALRITGWLQHELQQRRVTGLHENFVPRHVLRQLFEYEIVRKVLEEIGFDKHDTWALAHVILKHHLRWFAILIDIGIVRHIRAPFQAWTEDCDLPISRVQFLEKFKLKLAQTTVSPTVQRQPGSRKASTSQSFDSMETKRLEKLAELFCLRQREYLVPLLHEGGHYDSEDGVLPFLPIKNTTYSYDDESTLVLVYPAHHDYPPPYRGTENVDDGYLVALRSLHTPAIGPGSQYLISRGGSKVGPFHLLQAIASYRPPEHGGTPQPIRGIFPLSGASLDDVWRQSLVTGRVQTLLRWSLTQMAGLAKALAFVVENDREERYVSLRQITPCNIQRFKHTTFGSHGSGTLRLDLRTLMISQSKYPVRHFDEAYRAPDEYTMRELPIGRSSVWSLGCIYLEFLIWAVMGSTNLQRFREARGGANTPFYSKISSDGPKLADPSRSDHYEGFELSPEVCRWADTLQSESALPLVLRPLLEYLLGKVLVVNPSARVQALQLARDLEEHLANFDDLDAGSDNS
ncbi:NACHT domain protein [Aspergillus thermomutatus]|uniref:GPI inositol-deacylase winged helix domain-containing protein n=1 Tax=Aspergillus thermomutatus TaxID=41047 RepID=A0A397GSL3_ASPTH|nr:uncharacterized protein CDV56_103312 [Aspergillus thermomutatus]RHZ54012.1 hypothetical protein CDV56_103312 [Aspergillus thermomutatus]